MPELLPCPFCGSDDVHITDAFPHYIYCLNCKVMVQVSNKIYEIHIPEIANTWNTRTPKERGGEK